MSKQFETLQEMKEALFDKADYFVRNWAMEAETPIGNENQTKFCGLMEFIIEYDLENEYKDFSR